MRLNIFTRYPFIIAAVCLCITGCGSSDSSSRSEKKTKAVTTTSKSAEESIPDEVSSEEVKEITGRTEKWGIFSVLVPDGWTFRKGDLFDDNDPDHCSVKRSDLSYFDLKSETEEIKKRQYDYNHKTYTLDQRDLPPTTIAGIEWNGFEYGDSFVPGFELYASVGDKFIRVSCAGFTFDSAEAQAILGSLEIESSDAKISSSEGDASVSESTDSYAPSLLSSSEDIELTLTENETYLFTYNGEQFTAIYTPDNWKIIDSYRVRSEVDMVYICEALLNIHPIHSSDYEGWRTPEDCAYEWNQHNIANDILPDTSSWKQNTKDVDLNPEDQGLSFLEMARDRLQEENVQTETIAE